MLVSSFLGRLAVRLTTAAKAATTIAVLLAACWPAAAQTLIFDNADPFLPKGPRDQGTLSRSASDAVVTGITVTQTTTISAIAVQNDLAASGNLRFVIYENPNMDTNDLGVVLGYDPTFITSAQYFADDGMSYKQSASLRFTLTAGSTYYIGAITDVGATWNYDYVANTQSGITSQVRSGGITTQRSENETLPNPWLISNSGTGTDTPLRLYATVVPEPNSAVLLCAVLPLAGAVACRKCRTMTRKSEPDAPTT